MERAIRPMVENILAIEPKRKDGTFLLALSDIGIEFRRREGEKR
jgi:hypothetical protein